MSLSTWRVGRAARPITYVAISREHIAHPSWVLWETLRGRSLYRTVSVSAAARELTVDATIVDVATYRRLLTVVAEAIPTVSADEAIRAIADESMRAATYRRLLMACAHAELSEPLLDRYIEAPSLFDWLVLEAPITLSRAAANAAAIMRLNSSHLVCSVRFERGRWLVETGTGGMLVTHGSCDTQAEAVVVAQAVRDRAWFDAVERIRVARGGSLCWGDSVALPQAVAIYG